MVQHSVAENATQQSVERALSLLASFGEQRSDLAVSEMAQLLGVHKSTASRLAATLERFGFLARTGERFALGEEVVRLGSIAARSSDVVTRMRPAMEHLSQLTSETVNLAVPAGGDVLNVAEVPSTFILSCSGGWTGRRTRPHAVANGKVLVAFGALAEPTRFERYTAQTITTMARFRAELEGVRRDGFATAVAELEEGLVAVATPVFDGAGACVAALSVSGPSQRMPPESLRELGELCAAVLSQDAGRMGRRENAGLRRRDGEIQPASGASGASGAGTARRRTGS